MKEQGYRILLYKRYIVDILAIFEYQNRLQKRKGAEIMEKLLIGLHSKEGRIKVGGIGISSMRRREKKKQEEYTYTLVYIYIYIYIYVYIYIYTYAIRTHTPTQTFFGHLILKL